MAESEEHSKDTVVNSEICTETVSRKHKECRFLNADKQRNVANVWPRGLTDRRRCEYTRWALEDTALRELVTLDVLESII